MVKSTLGGYSLLMIRCINIDWLEVYTHEVQDGTPRDAEYFASRGFHVVQRPYGTRIYAQMFTIYDEQDQPLIEVRRAPLGAQQVKFKSVIPPDSAHIRLHNRTCYYDDAAQLLNNFCFEHGFIVTRISRIDLCLDFIRFDSGDDPQKFIERYLRGKYSKINQANIAAHGRDQWDGRTWNSLSWGSPKSMITTKIYDKTKELAEVKDKPYIRFAWLRSGLVDDMFTLTARKADGTIYKPRIWRLEFSIRSSVKGWFVVETFGMEKNKLHSYTNTLDRYYTRQQQLDVFACLVNHYFHFKLFQKDVRKDRCPDKQLFRFTDTEELLEMLRVPGHQPVSHALKALQRRLIDYKITHLEQATQRACEYLLRIISDEILRKTAAAPYDANEVKALRYLLAKNLSRSADATVDVDVDTYKQLFTLENEIF